MINGTFNKQSNFKQERFVLPLVMKKIIKTAESMTSTRKAILNECS
jgi:hypothetical protein